MFQSNTSKLSKPSLLNVSTEGIPAELKSINRWVMWRLVQKTKPNGEKVWTKVPFAVDGSAGSSTNSTTWSTYDDVCDALIMGGFDGIGLVLGDDIQGIDLDDCRDPATGALSDLAAEVLHRVDGYAEVSPSGTGIKIFARTNLDGSRTKKEVGVELYRDGRYFTVTGHAIGSVHLDKVNDLEWLIQKVWGENLAQESLTGDASEMALALYKAPIEEWDLDRVAQDILPHLNPDCGYEEWLKVGAILHHQGEGDPAWLDLWDNWSAGSGKWVEGYCEEKWNSFHTQRNVGRGAATLASLIKQTKDKRDAAKRSERDQMMADLQAKVKAVLDPRDLQEKIAASIAHNVDFTDVDRAMLVDVIRVRAKELGAKFSIPTIRGWVALRHRAAINFKDLNSSGKPACTIDNLKVLLAYKNYVVRYNEIKKSLEILIPDSKFSRDNRDNAAIAHVLSECEKASLSTVHVHTYLINVSDSNPFNPVRTWIDSYEWDGQPRIQKFLDTVRSKDRMKDRLILKWLIQCVAAAFSSDGIAGQGVLTFVGPQNIGKTTWFQRLAPPELEAVLTGHTLDTRNKDSVFIALSYWIVELGEVDATFRKSDLAALKSFITQREDVMRRPYAPKESKFGRRTVFGASVNDENYLQDPTGNRRFWTVEVESFDLSQTIDMQQVWAEVLVHMRSGENWNLDPIELAELNEHNNRFNALDPIEERLIETFVWDSDKKDWTRMTATQALMASGIDFPTKLQLSAASRSIRKLNGDQRFRSNGVVWFPVPSAKKAAEFSSPY